MDLASISRLASEQGPVFWAAAAAVSLGLTLLVVALLQGITRMITSRANVRTVTTSAASTESTPAPEAVPTAPTPEFVAAAYGADAVAAADPEPSENGSLALLLRRLQSAGDRLEEIAGDLETAATMSDGSLLKSEPRTVEYVFRASGS